MFNVHQYWVYIMSNKSRKVLYIGITNDLYRRYIEHKTGIVEGFTKKYRCHHLIYFEEYNIVDEAIAREKELKGWRREKKEKLITFFNPLKRNLAEDFGW
ncbi:MAG: GIY-YIG nuclease family protein [Bacteroidaceae bacterium]|nr:GIY-YIG nuclease family protein [Bacteroidaceae bacterium]